MDGAGPDPPLFGCLYSTPLVQRDGTALQPLDLLDVHTEVRLLRSCLAEVGKVIRFRSACATADNFQRLLSHGCRVVHFTGHGVMGKVGFESASGELHLLGSDELRDLFASACVDDSATPRTQLVFVSACHSASVASVFLDAGVPHVVAVDQSVRVQDKAAQVFERAFYRALLLGSSVRAAFDTGRAAVRCCAEIPPERRGEGEKFRLLGAAASAEGAAGALPAASSSAIFGSTATGAWIDEDGTPPPSHCDGVAEFFVGRALQVQRLFATFAAGSRMASVIGMHGVGKTQVALRMCEHARPRRLFSAFYYLPLRQLMRAAGPHGGACRVGEVQLVRWFAQAFRLGAPQGGDLAAPAGEHGAEGGQATARLLEQVRELCGGGRCLLLLDGCEELLDSEMFRPFLSQLLSRVQTLSLLITSVVQVGGVQHVGERVVPVPCLPPDDAAALFCLRSPRRLRLEEMRGVAVGAGSEAALLRQLPPLRALARHSVLQKLGGHPGAICAVAQQVNDIDLSCAADVAVLVDQVIPATLEAVHSSLGSSLFRHRCVSVANLRTAQRALPPCVVAQANCPCSHFSPAHAARSVSHLTSPRSRAAVELPHSGALQRSLSASSAPVAPAWAHPCESPPLRQWKSMQLPAQAPSAPAGSAQSQPFLPDSVASLHAAQQQQQQQQQRQRQQAVESCVGGGSVRAPGQECALSWCDARQDAACQALGEPPQGNGVVIWAGADVPEGTGATLASFGALAAPLCAFFARSMGESGIARPLSSADLQFLAKSARLWGGQAPGEGNGTVTLQRFALFWGWFKVRQALLQTAHFAIRAHTPYPRMPSSNARPFPRAQELVPVILRTGLWGELRPVKLHGFLNNAQARDILCSSAQGTFLMRFSESRAGSLVVAWVHESMSVNSVLVNVCVDGYQIMVGSKARTFRTLPHLLNSISVLQFLHPHHIKGDAFAL